MAGGGIPLPRGYCIPQGFERPELAKHPGVIIYCPPHAVDELSKSVAHTETVPFTFCANLLI